MEELKTQIVVIAGGPSGMSAAVQAAEDGADVIVIEKASITGGAANMGMGPLGIGTKYQQQQMIDISVEKAFNMFMDYTHYNVDARLVKRYFEQSAETIEWLEDMGVEFEGAFKYFPQSEATWHIVKTGNKIGPRAAGHMNKALREVEEKIKMMDVVIELFDARAPLSSINEQLEEGNKKLETLRASLLNMKEDTEEYLQTKALIANYELGAFQGKQELKRVEELAKPDLVFFEFVPVELEG